jgi:rhodanese-related sulfurtransferase
MRGARAGFRGAGNRVGVVAAEGDDPARFGPDETGSPSEGIDERACRLDHFSSLWNHGGTMAFSPLSGLAARLSDLPAGAEVVAYCRGPYCVLAPEAVELLRARGFRARRLADGLPDWAARGLPVATGHTHS